MLLCCLTLNCEVDSEDEQEEFYIVPSLLQPCKKGFPESPKTLKIEFDFIPLGFMSRLIAGLVNECGWKVEGEMFRDYVVLYSNEKRDIRIAIREEGKNIYLSAKRTEGQVGSCKRVLADVKRQLKMITASGICASKVKVLCIHEKCPSNCIPIDIGHDFKESICCPTCKHAFRTNDHQIWFDLDLHSEVRANWLM